MGGVDDLKQQTSLQTTGLQILSQDLMLTDQD